MRNRFRDILSDDFKANNSKPMKFVTAKSRGEKWTNFLAHIGIIAVAVTIAIASYWFF